MKILKQSRSYLTKLPEHEIEGKLLITQKIVELYLRYIKDSTIINQCTTQCTHSSNNEKKKETV